MVSSLQHHGDPGRPRDHGGKETPLSAVRPSGMEVSPSEALDMTGSPHLTISYLLRIGCGNLECQAGWLK